MKTSLPPFICLLICLLPTFLAGQANQEQNHQFLSPLLRGDDYLPSRQVSGIPLLRLSNLGAMADEGVRLELTSLPLLSQGPSILLDVPDPNIPRSGSIRLQPSDQNVYCKLEDVGSGTIDCIHFSLGAAVIPPYRPKLIFTKPLVSGIQSAITLEPGENTPKIRYTNFGSGGLSGVRMNVGNAPILNSYFDVFYDFPSGSVLHAFSDPTTDMILEMKFDKIDFTYSNRYSSTNPLWSDQLFIQSYKLPTFDIETKCNNLLETITFKPEMFEWRQKISTEDTMLSNKFFDITYDLDEGSSSMIFDSLRIKKVFEPVSPRLSMFVGKNGQPNVFDHFDVFYDIGLATAGCGFGQTPNNICYIHHFDPDVPSLQTKIESSDPVYQNSFFDITYDLDLGTMQTAHRGLKYVTQYNESEWDFVCRLTSTDPLIPSFFDITYDIGLNDLQSHSTKAGVSGTAPLELRYEYDGLNRKIRELRNDTESGSFFDITYDMDLGKIRTEHNNLACITEYDASKSEITIESLMPSIPDDFVITYDLEAGTHKMEFGGLSALGTFDDGTRHEISYSSSLPSVPGFFDISYDLSLGECKTEYNNLAFTVDANEPSLICWRFASSLPATPETFDICHDLDLGTIRTEYNDLVCTQSYIDASKSAISIESDLPAFPGFFDVTWDISSPTIPKLVTVAGISALAPLEVHDEFDVTTRRIRQISTDTGNGSSLVLERRLLPGNSSLVIDGGLDVAGPLSNSVGQLLLVDNVVINGSLQVNGPKMFRIDHPLDPENKYLVHSCVESPDMMNIYNGNVITDAKGFAHIVLPEYFEALNKDFRYQLTCVGQFAQAIVLEKIKDNRFTIQTDKPEVEVSWQVTGIRNDPVALNSGYVVEVEK